MDTKSVADIDIETVAEIGVMVERMARKIESVIDPEVRDGLEDAAGTMLRAVGGAY